MGQKVHPLGFRVGLKENYKSNWFVKPDLYHVLLSQDYIIRQNIYEFFNKLSFLKNKKRLSNTYNITDINISRQYDQIHVVISVIALEELLERKKVNSIANSIHSLLLENLSSLSYQQLTHVNSPKLVVIIERAADANLNAFFIARCLINQLENRVRFRKALKSLMNSVQKQDKKNELLGIKMKISGRLNGIEMARSEWIKEGSIPLQKLTADIDYCKDIAKTKYGILGVKVWVCKKKEKTI